MKNKAMAVLAALVLLFGGFTGGFFLGRNTRVGTIQTTKTVYETVPGETVIVMREVLVTLPPETLPPTEETTPSRGPVTEPNTTKPKETKEKEVTFPVNINTASKRVSMVAEQMLTLSLMLIMYSSFGHIKLR